MSRAVKAGDRVAYCKAWVDTHTGHMSQDRLRYGKAMAARRGVVVGGATRCANNTGGVDVIWDGAGGAQLMSVRVLRGVP